MRDYTKNRETVADRPDLLAEWHPSNPKPNTVTSKSGMKALWVCSKDNRHPSWEAYVFNRERGNGCPTCTGKVVVQGVNDLSTTKPEMVEEWDDDVLRPTDVTSGSNKKVKWRCRKGHRWVATIASRVSGRGCPYCSNRKVLKGYNDLQSTHPNIASEWSDANSKQSDEVVYGSGYLALWVCSYGHKPWKTSVEKRTKSLAGCPTCCNARVEVGINDLASQYPELMVEWDEDNEVRPTEITRGSPYCALWICSAHGHRWRQRVSHRTNGVGCPSCSTRVSKGETQLKEYVESLGVLAVSSDRSQLQRMEIDIWIPELGVGIEYDGVYWHSSDTSIERDERKNVECAEKKIPLLRVTDQQWTGNREDAEKMVRLFLERHGLTLATD